MFHVSDVTAARSERPFVSVIIPVYNDPRLTACLHAIGRQSYPTDRHEVIVVDNGSDASVAPAVAATVPHARVIRESRAGSYAARNRGLAEARGEIVALTDSDCVPATDWLEEGVRALHESPNCGLVGGRIDVFFGTVSPTPVEIFSGMTTRRQEQFIRVDHFAETANLFTSRTVLEAVGPFEATLKARGDVVFGQRVYAAGYGQVYADRAVVTHPAVRSLGQLRRRTARLVGGKHDVRRLALTASTRTASIDACNLPGLAARIWRRPDLGPGDRWRVLGILAFVQAVALCEGFRLLLGGTSRR
jgi:glycosyltransferase involved in cell wall biosynthesis